MDISDVSIDSKRFEKSLSLLTRKFVELLLSSEDGILDLKDVRIFKYFVKFSFKNCPPLKFSAKFKLPLNSDGIYFNSNFAFCSSKSRQFHKFISIFRIKLRLFHVMAEIDMTEEARFSHFSLFLLGLEYPNELYKLIIFLK